MFLVFGHGRRRSFHRGGSGVFLSDFTEGFTQQSLGLLLGLLTGSGYLDFGILINGGTNIPELFSVMNGNDGSQNGFRINSIGIALIATLIAVVLGAMVLIFVARQVGA